MYKRRIASVIFFCFFIVEAGYSSAGISGQGDVRLAFLPGNTIQPAASSAPSTVQSADSHQTKQTSQPQPQLPSPGYSAYAQNVASQPGFPQMAAGQRPLMPFVPTAPLTGHPAPTPVQAPAATMPEKTVAPPSVQPTVAPAAQPELPPAQPNVFATPPPVTQHVTAAKRGDVSFNFDDADVYSVIQTIFGDVLRVNYIIDPRVKGRVNFRSVSPVAKEDVLPLMEVILRLNGVGIVEEGGLYRIVPIGDLPKEPAPVGMGRDAEKIVVTGKARLQVVPIKYIQSTEMTRILTPFLSASAVIVDVPKSNHIVIIDTDANVKRLLQLVDTFDNEKLKQVTPRVFVYAVQNSKAKDLAALLQQIFQKGGASTAPKTGTTTTTQRPPIPGQPTPPTTPQISVGSQTSGEALVSEVTRIIPDEVTNSIVILATPEDYAFILDTIQRVDIMPRQVMLEGLIVQVTLTDNLSFGLSYSMNTKAKITGIKPFKNPIDLGSNASSSGNLGVNTTAFSKVPTDGFTFVGYDPTGNIRAVLTALEDRSKAKVVAAPHLLVADNREARIQVGQQIPLATSTSSQITAATTSTGIATTNTPVVGTTTVQYKDIGIILKVKPQVNDSGLISLELSQEISAVGDAVVVGGLDEVSINKTEVTSNLVARDGETIVIGGLIREDTSKGTSGVPLLSRIPILGALFGNTTDKVTRNEIIILLTPHVLRNQQEAKDVTSEFVGRYKEGSKDKDIDKFIKDKSQQKQEDSDNNVPQDRAEPR